MKGIRRLYGRGFWNWRSDSWTTKTERLFATEYTELERVMGVVGGFRGVAIVSRFFTTKTQRAQRFSTTEFSELR